MNFLANPIYTQACVEYSDLCYFLFGTLRLCSQITSDFLFVKKINLFSVLVLKLLLCMYCNYVLNFNHLFIINLDSEEQLEKLKKKKKTR